MRFAPGRDLEHVIETARAERPFLLAVDSIQTIRDTSGTQMPGGVSQVRTCTDALVGLAKAEGVAVLLTGHVTKDGDLAGPRALEHAVDVVLTFDGDPRSGLRVLTGGKNRFGAEGESAWFEMTAGGLREIDPTAPARRAESACPGPPPRSPSPVGAPSPSRSRRSSGPPTVRPGARRPVSTPDGSSWSRPCSTGPSGSRSVDPSSSGPPREGVKVDDPACDLAVGGRPRVGRDRGRRRPPTSAFVGEVSLTGLVRPAPAMAQRLAAARAAGVTTVFAPEGEVAPEGVRVMPVRHVAEALTWAAGSAAARPDTLLNRRSA